MTEFSWNEIIVIVFGGGGVVAGLVSLLKEISARYDKAVEDKKKAAEKAAEEKRKAAELENTTTIELRRLELSEDERNNAEWQKILAYWEKRVEDLKQELKEIKDTDSLARPVITRIYQNVRRVRTEVDRIDSMIFRLQKHEVLAAQCNEVKKHLDNLEKALP